jgi:hypothetical protein
MLVFAPLALLALPSLRRDRRRLLVALGFLAAALLMLAGFLSGNMELFRRTIKVTTAGRYLTPALAALAVVAARWGGRGGGWLWGLAVAAGLWLARPVAWAPSEPGALGLAALALAAMAGAVAAAVAAHRRGWLSAGVTVAAAVVVLALGCAALGSLRAAHRYELWEAAADREVRTFHMHPLHAVYTAAWPIWRELDSGAGGGEGHRLAVTAGWDGLGHNWYQYPLLGSRLQNRVVHVPVTADGGIADYREPAEVARRASFEAWLGRLVESEVDHLVSLAPRTTVEELWMGRMPEIFAPAATDPQGLHIAYRFDREAALVALERSRVRVP